MNDVVSRYYPVISERHEPKDGLETFVRATIWDSEIRAAIWHIQELEVVYKVFRKHEQEERGK